MIQSYAELTNDILVIQDTQHSLEYELANNDNVIASLQLQQEAQEPGNALSILKETLDRRIAAGVQFSHALEKTKDALKHLLITREKCCDVLRHYGIQYKDILQIETMCIPKTSPTTKRIENEGSKR